MNKAGLKELEADVREEIALLPEGHHARAPLQKVRAMIDATLHATRANEDPNSHNCDQILSRLAVATDLARGPSVHKEPKKSGAKKSGKKSSAKKSGAKKSGKK